jgi:pyruvate/2-oxoglutarate dehydrogenase complex dihydrolipoamide dehydrogenase (E3) component
VAERIDCDICVIGGGSGGLSVAAGASLLGARAVLIERAHMGGDCLNFGCVPSKALLAAAKAAAGAARAKRFGVTSTASVDFAAVNDHVKGVIAAIAPQDSVERFEGLGVTVILAKAAFVGPQEVEAGGRRIRARRIVIATGSSPVAPPIPGLADVPYLTNETVFAIRDRPAHLLILGAGPIGMEMAQAHRRLGSQVTVIEALRALGRDDPELAAVVTARLRAEGVSILEGAKVERVQRDGAGIALGVAGAGGQRAISGSHLLVAAGRKANVEGLNLEAAGIAYSPKGVVVDARLRTTNKKVFAIGDAAGGPQFTHLAGYHAGIVLRNALFRWPAKSDPSALPWVTFTDPELASVGLDETAARQRAGVIRILRWGFAENDRAQAERDTDGMIKVITDKGGRILGAGIVGPHAGELIQPWILALSRRLKIGAMASVIAPYPTFGEVGKRAAGAFFTPKLFSERTRRLVRFLGRFG